MSVAVPAAADQVKLFVLCCQRYEYPDEPPDGVLPVNVAGVVAAQTVCDAVMVLLLSGSHPVRATKMFWPLKLSSVIAPNSAVFTYSPAT